MTIKFWLNYFTFRFLFFISSFLITFLLFSIIPFILFIPYFGSSIVGYSGLLRLEDWICFFLSFYLTFPLWNRLFLRPLFLLLGGKVVGITVFKFGYWILPWVLLFFSWIVDLESWVWSFTDIGWSWIQLSLFVLSYLIGLNFFSFPLKSYWRVFMELFGLIIFLGDLLSLVLGILLWVWMEFIYMEQMMRIVLKPIVQR